MKAPIYLAPAYREKVWGGDSLKTLFGLDIPSDHTGEAWIVSAYEGDESHVIAPDQYKGLGLRTLYSDHPELFGEPHPDKFPLLVKFLDAQGDLSVQVHPDDAYAAEHENSLGKTESWYILKAEPNQMLVYGHHAKTKEEFDHLIDERRWDELLREVPIEAGEFYDVPSGTLHALKAGTVALETQQSSDITYRVYDYDRPDRDGQLRPLHIEQAKAVTTVPDAAETPKPTEWAVNNGTLTRFVNGTYFSVYRLVLNGTATLSLPKNYYIATVVEGSGTLTIDSVDYPLALANSLIIPNAVTEATVSGSLTVIASHPNFA